MATQHSGEAAQRATALLAGAIFGVGLTLSGMTRPDKVLAFLDVTGAWDPALALVMGGALALYGLLYPLVRRRPAPALAPRFQVPTRSDITARLLAGAALFGVGWGLGGLCPGPALTSAGPGLLDMTAVSVFLPMMLLGMIGFNALDARLSRET